MMQMSRHQAATHIQAAARGRKARATASAGTSASPLLGELVTSSHPAKGAAWAAEDERPASELGYEAEIDRERLCSDILNTSVMGALVGGFALSNMQQPLSTTPLEGAIYLASCFAVHSCTCSCLTSALLYRIAVRMHDDAIPQWAEAHKWLLRLPLAKFGMGCVSYLLTVILLSFRDLQEDTALQYIALVIGVMSMSTVFLTVLMLSGKVPTACRPGSRRVLPSSSKGGKGM